MSRRPGMLEHLFACGKIRVAGQPHWRLAMWVLVTE